MGTIRRIARQWGIALPAVTFLFVFTASPGTLSPVATQAALPQATAPQAPAAPDTDLPKFLRVNDGLALGAQPTTPGIRKLSEMGFKTVVNLVALKEGSMIEAKTVEFYGLKFVNLECNPEDFTAALLDEFTRIIQIKEDQPIYVHCKNGNRTGALWMIYLVKKEGWKPDAALEVAVKLGLTDAAIRDAAMKYIGRPKA